MEPIEMPLNGGNQELPADTLPFARSYQLEALEKAIKQNTIVFLETGSGKTLIAIMLLRSYAHLLRKPSPFIAVFLVPKVVLVTQQAEAIMMHTDMKVGKYWGEMGVDFWDAATWKQQQDTYEVLVMTPQILLDALRHSFLKLDKIKVLIFDECHNARGNYAYACIMKEFYHPQLATKNLMLPRVFGMTASPVKAKAKSSSEAYWKQICDLENLMNSKVYTCINESVLAKYIPFATPKLKFYNHVDIPCVYLRLKTDLKSIRYKYECSLRESSLPESMVETGKNKLKRLHSDFLYCLQELGIWIALKAAQSLASVQYDIFSWGKLEASSENAVRGFCLDASKVFSACMPSDKIGSIARDKDGIVDAGYLTSKVICLLECLLEYRDLKDMRCIIFVERIITAIVLRSLLNDLPLELDGWKTEYMAGHQSQLLSQSRQEQNKIVEKFRRGTVNIIVATSILEEGLDVQSCNLVIRFDPSATICGFIQSRGRARKQNSDFIIMMKSNDTSTLTRVKNYLSSGDIMRKESLRHGSVPCTPLDLYDEVCYRVEATGAIVTLSSSVALLHFYCSRLPSDGYFKPYPRFVMDKDFEICILHLPKSCPIPTLKVEGNIKILKQLACLEACKQLHLDGALTDNLVPDIVEEEANVQELGFEYNNEQVQYFPPELIRYHSNESETLYYCYLVELRNNFYCDTQLRDVVLAVRSRFDFHDESMALDLVDDSISPVICTRYVGAIRLTSEQVLMCRRFQVTLLRILLDHNLNKLNEALGAFDRKSDFLAFDYLLLPAADSNKKQLIDWNSVRSVLLPSTNIGDTHLQCFCARDCGQRVYTKSGLVCSCVLENSLVCTPHNDYVYHIAGTLDGLDGKSSLKLQGGEVTTYRKYYEKRHGIPLQYEGQSLLHGRHVTTVQNYLLKCRKQKTKEPSNASVELPPELCRIIMSPISLATLHSFSYAPSIMHRVESLLLAANLKKMHLDHCTKNAIIPTIKVLEAITTKKCQENLHLESLETLGDSFLKYATSQQLFKTYQSHHEGLLSIKREKIICNTALCKLGCNRKIPGFIRNEPFDLKTWIIPGDNSVVYALEEEELSPTKKIYGRGRRKIKSKTVADVVEALIGAFLSGGGEMAALSFMEWLGIKVNFVNGPYVRQFAVHPEMYVNIRSLESLLNYSFHDASFLVEALTHGSYMLPEIPRCYQRLEFLGDAVLDYLITVHLYKKYPGLSPGLLTDLRSASVNNDCYAQSAVKAGLNKHILHASPELQRQVATTVQDFDHLSLASTFGWESETAFPKVLGDIIESLCGAIFVDSNYNKERVFQSIRPLLEPLITPESLKLHPARELFELCQKEHYIMKKQKTREKGVTSMTVEVEANGIIYKNSGSSSDKNIAKKLACKGVLKLLKDNMVSIQARSSI